MALADTLAVIAVIAALGFGLAWLVGRLAERDRRRRLEEGDPFAPPPEPPAGQPPVVGPAGPGAAPAVAAAVAGACPTCRTAYRPDLDFCWACGRDKA